VNDQILQPVELPFGKVIYQHKGGQTITEDTAELVRFVLEEIKSELCKVLDLGSGTGIMPIMFSHYRPDWEVIGIEIQSQLVELSRHNNRSAGTTAEFVERDLKDINIEWSDSFDIVVSNPPYFPLSKGKVSTNPERAISRTELKSTMADIIETTKFYMTPDGVGYILYPASRRDDFIEKCRGQELVVKQEISINERDTTTMFKVVKKR